MITPVKILACTIIDLLTDGAQLAEEVIKDFVPQLDKNEYLSLLDNGVRRQE